jgi:hypothetical protein
LPWFVANVTPVAAGGTMKNITPATDQPPAQPDKPRRISTKVRTAIDAMVAGGVKTIADAARSAGLSREHLSRELSKPHIAEHIRRDLNGGCCAPIHRLDGGYRERVEDR